RRISIRIDLPDRLETVVINYETDATSSRKIVHVNAMAPTPRLGNVATFLKCATPRADFIYRPYQRSAQRAVVTRHTNRKIAAARYAITRYAIKGGLIKM